MTDTFESNLKIHLQLDKCIETGGEGKGVGCGWTLIMREKIIKFAKLRTEQKIKQVQTGKKPISQNLCQPAQKIDVLKVKSVSRKDSWSKYFQTFPIQHNQNFDIVLNFCPSTIRESYSWTYSERDDGDKKN